MVPWIIVTFVVRGIALVLLGFVRSKQAGWLADEIVLHNLYTLNYIMLNKIFDFSCV